jgi:hypothetical protein
MKVRVVLLVCAIAVAIALSIYGRRYKAEAVLDVACRELTNPPPPEAEGDAILTEQMEMLASKSVLTAALHKPEIAALPSVKARHGDAVEWLCDKMKIERPSKADRIVVSCRMNDAHEAVLLTNAVVDAYMADQLNTVRKLYERYDDLDSRVGKMQLQLDAKVKALDGLAAASRDNNAKPSSTSRPSDSIALQTEIKSLKRALEDLTFERDKTGIEIKMRPRVTIVERAQEPKVANQSSL